MSDLIRLELTGKHAEAWNRVFDTLISVVEKAVDQLAPCIEENTRDKTKKFAHDLADITKGFLKAKLEQPMLENEQVIAEIAIKFEELKIAKANRERLEVETEIKKVTLEQKRLELWEQRMVTALKWLGFLQHHLLQQGDNDAVLLLTNQELRSLLSEVRGFQKIDRTNGSPKVSEDS